MLKLPAQCLTGRQAALKGSQGSPCRSHVGEVSGSPVLVVAEGHRTTLSRVLIMPTAPCPPYLISSTALVALPPGCLKTRKNRPLERS